MNSLGYLILSLCFLLYLFRHFQFSKKVDHLPQKAMNIFGKIKGLRLILKENVNIF